MGSRFLLFSELCQTEQIILSGIRTWANNIRFNKNPIPSLECFYKSFNLENISTLTDDLMCIICTNYKVHLDLRCNCNMIISNHEQIILESLYYSQIKFDELERKTLINIVKDKYAREVMLVNNKINKILIKNKYNFESRDSHFNFNLKCLNKHL